MAQQSPSSWRTTTAAVLAAVAAIATALMKELDGDPATVADWGTTISLIITAIGLFLAKDHKVK